jgi:glyoxylase-like metal-dependent hydrolase (beta-lactamase superfamily II)
MKVKVFTVNPYRMNSYIYYDEINLEGFIIDPGYSSEEEFRAVYNFIRKNNIKIKYIINTHGHIDHIAGLNPVRETFAVKSYLHNNDTFLIDTILDYSEMFGFELNEKPFIDEYITDSLELTAGDLTLKFIHTPGHSPGGVCAVDHFNKTVFCGDLIFRNSVGRTDLPGGNTEILFDSIKNRLFTECEDDYILCPGHMDATTVYEEKNFNQFLTQ